jgi:sigma-B regulation protein RsbU (phosphoserine phosphatase)
MSSEPVDPLAPAGSSRRVLSVVLTNQLREIARLADLIEEFGRKCGLSEDDATNISLMLDEVVSNVIKYAFDDTREHHIHIEVACGGGLVTMHVEDEGKPFNPLNAPAPNLDLAIEERPIGGLGIFITKALADSLAYRRDGMHNVLTMTKKTQRR